MPKSNEHPDFATHPIFAYFLFSIFAIISPFLFFFFPLLAIVSYEEGRDARIRTFSAGFEESLLSRDEMSGYIPRRSASRTILATAFKPVGHFGPAELFRRLSRANLREIAQRCAVYRQRYRKQTSARCC